MRTFRIALVAAMVAGLLAQTAPAQKKNTGNPEKVEICHFPGHDGDFQIRGNEECEPDGNAIQISRKAAVRGHRVELDDEDDEN